MFFTKWFKGIQRKDSDSLTENAIPVSSKLDSQTLSKVEKELIMVQRVTTSDMEQFTMIPYQLNCPVKKFVKDGGHPFAYMDLNQANQVMAKEEIEKINVYLRQAREYIPSIPIKTEIHIDQIVFSPYSDKYGYTRLVCNPYTFSGKISKYPLCLNFMSRLDRRNQDVGCLYYGQDGRILKADVNIFRNNLCWAFAFKTVGRTFVLHDVSTSDNSGQMKAVYKFQ